MRNFKLIVAYDGAAYLGWQKTPFGPTIESMIQNVLEKILQHPVVLQAASRTDAGVHAYGQVANFYSPKKELSPIRLHTSLNRLLPKDISVLSVEEVESTFHPTLDCTGKEYHYCVCYGKTQLPLHRHFSWHYPHELNAKAMRKAALELIGTHDYSSFCNIKNSVTYKHFVRTVTEIEIEELGHKRLQFKIAGTNFLYKMVRNLVGTIVYVGSNKIRLEDIPSILLSQDRILAGITAPAHGLTLWHCCIRRQVLGFSNHLEIPSYIPSNHQHENKD